MNAEETHNWFHTLLTSFESVARDSFLKYDGEALAGMTDAATILNVHHTVIRGIDDAGSLTGNQILVEMSGYLTGAIGAALAFQERDRLGAGYTLGFVEFMQKVEQAIAYVAGVIV